MHSREPKKHADEAKQPRESELLEKPKHLEKEEKGNCY
tara:strand:- start:92 stop:205 length:114 start_codon:yes stop_codon:yes gene_type:complete